MKKILIAIPCMDQVATPFAISLATLNKVEDCTIHTLQGSLIYESRNQLARFAVSNNFDFIMWFDSDMMFQPDVIQKMLAHMEAGKTIVSGLYFRRVAPYNPVLFKDLDVEHGKWSNYDDYPHDSVFEVGGVGFGCVMTDVQVLFDIAAKYNTSGFFNPMAGYGEDLAFCQRAKEAGHKIYCDSTIKCGHVGSIIAGEELRQAYKGAAKK